MALAKAYGPYFKFPLVIPDLRFGNIEELCDPKAVGVAMLIFEPIGNGWRCVSCSEARGLARTWTGSADQIDAHCEAHQMGFDYALCCLKKLGRLR